MRHGTHAGSDRLRNFVPAAFRKHGFRFRPRNGSRLRGRSFPYVWMLAWPNSDVRAKAFGDLWADPDFQTLRTRTNGAREMVLRYDIYLMHDKGGRHDRGAARKRARNRPAP